MNGITPENVGKHGVLALGESRLVGTVINAAGNNIYEFEVDGDPGADINLIGKIWTFTPDAPKARLGMIVQVMRYHDYEDDFLVRGPKHWHNLTNPNHFEYSDVDLADRIANPVFPGVADL